MKFKFYKILLNIYIILNQIDNLFTLLKLPFIEMAILHKP